MRFLMKLNANRDRFTNFVAATARNKRAGSCRVAKLTLYGTKRSRCCCSIVLPRWRVSRMRARNRSLELLAARSRADQGVMISTPLEP
jgi:hypothetical protein